MRKFLSVMLVLCMIVPFAALGLTADATDLIASSSDAINPSISANESEAIIDVLNFVEKDKGSFAMSNVNFESLMIGNKIHKYEVTSNGIHEIGYLYPIIYEGKPIAVATPIEDGYFEISIFEATAIAECNSTNIAFIFDSSCGYIFDGTTLHPFYQSDAINPNRISIENIDLNAVATNSVSNVGNISLSDLSACQSLGYYRFNEINANSSSYYYCNITHVSQPSGTNTCWAACVAMVANFHNKTSLTLDDVTTAYPAPNGRTLSETTQLMRTAYDLNYRCCGDGYDANSNPTDGIIARNIAGEYPIIGKFEVMYSETFMHGAVIYAIDLIRSYISVDDPQLGVKTSRRFHSTSPSDYDNHYYYSKPDNTYIYLVGYSGRWLEDS